MGFLHIGFLIDPLEQLQPEHDTSFALLLESLRRGHDVHVFEQSGLGFRAPGTYARMRRLRPGAAGERPYAVDAGRDVFLHALDVVFLRKNPPVDVAFLHATQLLERCAHPAPAFINSPRGLRDANEKLWALQFPRLIPPTWISASPVQLRTFLDQVQPDAVLKPLDGHGGRGVVRLRKGDPNLPSLLELLTQHGTQPALLQAYLPESREGDKRILVLDGEPLGAVLRVPREDDVCANLARGAQARKTTVTQDDLRLCASLAPALRAHGLWFVGLDVIGGRLTEVNVTSPTGLQEINLLDGTKLETSILTWVEQRVRAAGANRPTRPPIGD